jgi:hypothetical protein
VHGVDVGGFYIYISKCGERAKGKLNIRVRHCAKWNILFLFFLSGKQIFSILWCGVGTNAAACWDLSFEGSCFDKVFVSSCFALSFFFFGCSWGSCARNEAWLKPNYGLRLSPPGIRAHRESQPARLAAAGYRPAPPVTDPVNNGAATSPGGHRTRGKERNDPGKGGGRPRRARRGQHGHRCGQRTRPSLLLSNPESATGSKSKSPSVGLGPNPPRSDGPRPLPARSQPSAPHAKPPSPPTNQI